MTITLNDLTVNFEHLERERILEDWRWLIGPNKQAILLTASGDAFVQDAEDGSVHFLDVASGKIQEVAASAEEFRSLLTDREFVLNFFAVEMVADLRQHGVSLLPGQIYSFKHPPVLGGDFTFENIEAVDILVHVSLGGQIHRQVKDLPPGTQIDSIAIEPQVDCAPTTKRFQARIVGE